MTIDQLIHQFMHDAERGSKAIDRLTLRPTKNGPQRLKSWNHHLDVCVATLEKLERLKELEEQLSHV